MTPPRCDQTMLISEEQGMNLVPCLRDCLHFRPWKERVFLLDGTRYWLVCCECHWCAPDNSFQATCEFFYDQTGHKLISLACSLPWSSHSLTDFANDHPPIYDASFGRQYFSKQQWLEWLGPGPRCFQCGLQATLYKHGEFMAVLDVPRSKMTGKPVTKERWFCSTECKIHNLDGRSEQWKELEQWQAIQTQRLKDLKEIASLLSRTRKAMRSHDREALALLQKEFAQVASSQDSCLP